MSSLSMASRMAAQRQARSAARTGAKRRGKQRVDANGSVLKARPPPSAAPPSAAERSFNELKSYNEQLEREDAEARQRLIDHFLNLRERG